MTHDIECNLCNDQAVLIMDDLKTCHYLLHQSSVLRILKRTTTITCKLHQQKFLHISKPEHSAICCPCRVYPAITWGRKNMPIPDFLMSSPETMSLKSSQGIDVIIPAPSPLLVHTTHVSSKQKNLTCFDPISSRADTFSVQHPAGSANAFLRLK
jgi:hypothetical protein